MERVVSCKGKMTISARRPIYEQAKKLAAALCGFMLSDLAFSAFSQDGISLTPYASFSDVYAYE